MKDGEIDTDRLLEEADELVEADPEHFSRPSYNQPGGYHVEEAREFLGEDAPEHHVLHLAHKFQESAERAEEEIEHDRLAEEIAGR